MSNEQTEGAAVTGSITYQASMKRKDDSGYTHVILNLPVTATAEVVEHAVTLFCNMETALMPTLVEAAGYDSYDDLAAAMQAAKGTPYTVTGRSSSENGGSSAPSSYLPAGPTDKQKNFLQNLIDRLQLTEDEVSALAGEKGIAYPVISRQAASDLIELLRNDSGYVEQFVARTRTSSQPNKQADRDGAEKAVKTQRRPVTAMTPNDDEDLPF